MLCMDTRYNGAATYAEVSNFIVCKEFKRCLMDSPC